MFKTELLINAGQYQNIVLTISGETIGEFWSNMDAFTDEMRARLGLAHAELESWASSTRHAAIEGKEDEATEIITSAMGGAVISSEVVKTPPQPTQEPKAPLAKTKPWEAKAPATSTSLDSF